MRDGLRLPRVLDVNLDETARVHPTELSIDLHLRACSTAKMTLPDEDPRLETMPFVELFTARGSAGVFRVYDSTEPVSGTRSYTLRHGIDTLRDSVWREKTDYEGTVPDFLARLLDWQTTARWQLGVCADQGAYKRDKINFDHLDKLLDELRESREGYYFDYDFTTQPWTLNFRALQGSVEAEMRPTRNLTDASLRRTRNGMVNRLHLSVDDAAPAQYDDTASQQLHGVSEGTASVTAEEAPDPADWAQRFFSDHARPIASATCEAWEIVKTTGEPWDALDLGKTARVAAGRPGFPLSLPIESLRYEGLAGNEPERVRAELQRRLPKFSERLSSAQKKADKSDEEAAETQREIEAMNQEITTLRDGMAQTRAYSSPKLLETNIFYLYVGTDAPNAATQHNIVWIKPGSAADADGTIPCEVKYIP